MNYSIHLYPENRAQPDALTTPCTASPPCDAFFTDSRKTPTSPGPGRTLHVSFLPPPGASPPPAGAALAAAAFDFVRRHHGAAPRPRPARSARAPAPRPPRAPAPRRHRRLRRRRLLLGRARASAAAASAAATSAPPPPARPRGRAALVARVPRRSAADAPSPRPAEGGHHRVIASESRSAAWSALTAGERLLSVAIAPPPGVRSGTALSSAAT